MENVIKGYPEVPQSITNNNVLDANALDRNQAFSFIQFIKVIKISYEPDTLQDYYTLYLNKWNNKTNSKNTTNKTLIIDRYKDFLKEITINFSNQTEKKFLQHLDFES